jgi:hypothetical protein
VRLSRSTFAAALTVVAFSPALAHAEECDVSGTIEANPLRIDGIFFSYRINGPAALAERLNEVAGMGRKVTAHVDKGASEGFLHNHYPVTLLSVSGHATAPTELYCDPELDAISRESIPPETEFTITGAEGDWMDVRLADGKTGYVPASFTSVGEDHVLARDIGRDVLGPLFAKTSAHSDARTFHPDGLYFEGTVTSLDPPAPLASLAQRLVGSAVVRPSLGVHKAGTPDGKFDVPGFTIRLTTPGAPIGAEPLPGDENFTFLADLKSLAYIFVAPFKTDQFDYLDPGNVYYPAIAYRIAPTAESDAEPTQDVALRVLPEAYTPADASLAHPKNGADRDKKLMAAIQDHKAALRVEASLDGGKTWTPLVRISMDQTLPMDNEAFHYYPDLVGRGLIPQGVVNALRAEVYPDSQAARPQTDAERAADTAPKQAPEKGIVDALPPVGN